MATITNISTSTFTLIDLYNRSREILPGATLSLDNSIIVPDTIFDAENRGILTITGWSPSRISVDTLNLPQVMTYNADGTLNTISVVYNTHTWVQTYTWTNGKATGISAWVQQ